jgi:hypothetical protein
MTVINAGGNPFKLITVATLSIELVVEFEPRKKLKCYQKLQYFEYLNTKRSSIYRVGTVVVMVEVLSSNQGQPKRFMLVLDYKVLNAYLLRGCEVKGLLDIDESAIVSWPLYVGNAYGNL